jgi:hypothetical protein
MPRAQEIEGVSSRDKRRLGTALTARIPAALAAGHVPRVLTHNLLLLYRACVAFQRSRYTFAGIPFLSW